jgi:methionine-S-sulfoxide reductase
MPGAPSIRLHYPSLKGLTIVNTISTKVSSLRTRSGLAKLAGALVLAVGVIAVQRVANSAEAATQIPVPAQDEKVAATHSETAVFAGGCFWGVQGVFEHVRGVKQVAAGYSGGAAGTAQYETVEGGDTGHAESVQITYDPTQITYGRLLQIFFSVAHNPTELNYQGPDHGTQYRSAGASRGLTLRSSIRRMCSRGRWSPRWRSSRAFIRPKTTIRTTSCFIRTLRTSRLTTCRR